MSRRDPIASLQHMLEYAQNGIMLSRGKKRDDLDDDIELNLALTRLVEVIGEAANRVPESFRNDNPEIPWSDMIGMRNRLIHGYDEVDLDFLWSVIQNDLPQLIIKLKNLL